MILKKNKKMKYNIFISSCLTVLLFLSFFSFPAFSQTPYDDLKESDQRVYEIRDLIQKNQPLPETFRMRYSGNKGNYLSFYDRDGNEIYFQYRIDRWDHDAEKKINHLIPGQAYEISGSMKGITLENRYYSSSHPDFLKLLPNKSAIIVMEFQAATPLKPDQILFGAGETFYDPRFFLNSGFQRSLL